ncbi:EscU/YscU/HrcU family type III secretion system export apparatus switch protein [Pseudobacillus wudalianchiensis]|uniref:Flagellar biosynthesis protein FlhS n=1 Tax=Pseudobacillus wudalianchiensis TaxID=1743143 RepID=A0A1B9AYG2_9BACI|nr:EscU/YscU/HrcU family type III secretion system export apparatus switch protein [Bacillus wudalianchiensis]OCA89015.1 flagellar biosynthesis protein FlhS [Bacillus wudalianchiensis]
MMPKYFNQVSRKRMNGPSAAVIRYDEGSDTPTVVAQGKGQLAAKIIELANKHNIHMEEDESLLSNLLDIDLGDSIPPQLYTAIAEILILIEEMEKKY